MKPAGVTGSEMAVLEVLWGRPEGATVREIVLAMYGRHEHSLHGGVKSFLDKLMSRGWVTVDKSEFAHRFAAKIAREQFVGIQLREIAESHFGGSVAPLLLSLVDPVPLSKKDRAAIQKIIENMRE